MFCIAKNRFTFRKGITAVAVEVKRDLCGFTFGLISLIGWALVASPLQASINASANASSNNSPGASADLPTSPAWLSLPRVQGRLTAAELGLLINLADPYSVAVGEYYARRRSIPEANILRLSLPTRATLTVAEFDALNDQVRAKLGLTVQALALAWSQPYAVECNSITAALAMGFQAEICKQSCAASKQSPYFSYLGARPAADLGFKPAMLLAARSVQSGQALIERGIAADHSLPAFAPVNAFFVSTPDKARNVRAVLFPPPGLLRSAGVEVHQVATPALPPLRRTLIYQTGLAQVDGLDSVEWQPGALADHLTSYGGQLERLPQSGQMSAVDWLEAGATASYGAVSEPCNHVQKFPHPQLLLLFYLQGMTALEAYWHSVEWPGQGVFIGEPLAAPFAPLFSPTFAPHVNPMFAPR